MTGRRVLLVSPSFHGYADSVARALLARGHSVVVHRYDLNRTARARARHQLRHELPRRLASREPRWLSDRQTTGAVTAVVGSTPDVVVVIKGDTLARSFWELLDDRRLPRVVWLYDELRRTAYDDDTLRRAGPLATYSGLDAAALTARGIPAAHLPLGFDQHLVEIDRRRRHDEVVFVGARYPERERLLTGLVKRGIPVRAFGRQWSAHPVDRMRTWDLRRPAVPSGRDLDRADAYQEMAAAPATLNIHGDQDGFTMRTFEASGVGGLQLIDRPDVSDLYEPGSELCVFTDDEELADLCRRAATDRSWGEGIRERGRRRTLAAHTLDHRVAVLEELWQRWA